MSQIKGILDQATQEVVVLTDDKITLRSNVKIHGTLDVGLVRTTEIIADSRFEKKYFTFVSTDNDHAGTGLIWIDKVANKEITFRLNPDRFFISEHVDLAQDKAYLIGGVPVVTRDSLSPGILESNLQRVGTLKNLKVNGDVSIAEHVFFNHVSGRLSIGNPDPNGVFSVYDNINDVEIIIEGTESGSGKIGTFTNRRLELVAGNQTKIIIGTNGIVDIGPENGSTGHLRVNGKISVNVKNPTEDLEVNGNMRFSGIKFSTGTQPPDTGFHNKGDIVWNSNPMQNAYVGWVCLSTGNPGQWHPFGLIPG